ncbi:hypothetical protein COM13_11880 [Bacillus pseudomycoides]|nr:hypothetical protein BLX05_23030 [Bacillus pseudomycoides]PDY02505.1 hypothetical protein COO07_00640 [Bacillus pseudomycoides]PDY11398.1 hypothetical protein COO16_15885 [Bacillus pseudomycoides]PEB40742.1 hypothetical protein COO06_16230 [Bacillus pseudomycoides]PEF75560.1 hypothetical protein CON94_09905 [Bacillus pseudomycoides]
MIWEHVCNVLKPFAQLHNRNKKQLSSSLFSFYIMDKIEHLGLYMRMRKQHDYSLAEEASRGPLRFNRFTP